MILYKLMITMETISSKVSMKYQITLPRQVRDIINIKAGDCVVFVKDDSRIYLVRLDDLRDEVLDSFNDLEDTEKEFRKGFRVQELDKDLDIGRYGNTNNKSSIKADKKAYTGKMAMIAKS
jgi:AbrB family looped-hinge helix DNA binding protein